MILISPLFSLADVIYCCCMLLSYLQRRLNTYTAAEQPYLPFPIT